MSVVIPALDVGRTLGQQLSSLARQTYSGPTEVLIADNGSRDGTRDVASSFAAQLPGLRIVDASSSRGINHARNAGARAAEGDLLLFCDGDDAAGHGWIECMVEALKDFDGVGGEVATLGVDDESPRLPRSMDRGRRLLPAPIGANCGVRRQVWSDLGGFDESYTGGAGDEVDFFWRLQLGGYRFGAAPGALMSYRVPPDLRTRVRKAYRTGRERGRLHSRFRGTASTARPLGTVFLDWLRLAARLPTVPTDRVKRHRWLIDAAGMVGKAVGSLKYRTLYL